MNNIAPDQYLASEYVAEFQVESTLTLRRRDRFIRIC